MPLLPQYQRIPEASEELPLYHKSPPKPDTEDADDVIATYPPGPSTREGAPVEYIFVPRYPVTGSMESALGVMGVDKEQTIEFVQRAFPKLAEYPPGRIEFSVTTGDQKPAQEAGWSRILDETWPRLQSHPPTRMKVMIQDGPGDAARRTRRDVLIFVSVVSSPFILGGAIIGVVSFVQSL